MTKETRSRISDDAGTGRLFIKGLGVFDVRYTIQREQRTISRRGLGAAPGLGSTTGTVRKVDGTLLTPSVEFPVPAMLRDETGNQWTISLEADGSFIAEALA